MKRPGGSKPCACALHESIGEDANMNVDVISTFHRGEEGFIGISSIKTDINFALGCV